jgi:hypothetical protein
MELYLPPIIEKGKAKRPYRPKIIWTQEMFAELERRFPHEFNKDIAKDLGIGWRSLVRKARELGLQKEPGFLDTRRADIVTLILKVRKPNPAQQGKGFIIPNSEPFRFKKGHTPRIAWDQDLRDKIHQKRNQTIARDRLRIKYGLSRITKLKLNW